MSRRPINVEMRGLQTPRERVWAAILLLAKTQPEGFGRDAIQDKCNPMVRWTLVDDYTEDLVKSGHLARVPGSGARKDVQQPLLFTLTKASGTAPRVSQAGLKVTQGSGNEAMWRAMKVLPVFDHQDIARAATLGSCTVSVATAKTYVAHLARAGYLTTIKPSKPGTPAKHRLDRNTGMHPPAITRLKVVFDRNTGEFANLQTAQEVCDGLE